MKINNKINKPLLAWALLAVFIVVTITAGAWVFTTPPNGITNQTGIWFGNISLDTKNVTGDKVNVVGVFGSTIGSYVDSYSCDASYCIYMPWYASGKVYAKNMSSGEIEFKGVNSSPAAGENSIKVIMHAMDAVESAGGGTVWVKSGTYLGATPLDWTYNKTRLVGEDMNTTKIWNAGNNSINVTTAGAVVDIENLYIYNTANGGYIGVGIYLPIPSGGTGANITVDLKLHKVTFKTILNSILYENNAKNASIGNIDITDSVFDGSAYNTDGSEYPNGYHVVTIHGRKDQSKKLVIENNVWIRGSQRSESVFLSIAGEKNSAFDKNGRDSTAVWGGSVKGNRFYNSTRECFILNDAREIIVQENYCQDSGRIGFFIERQYRTNVIGNIVNGSFYRAYRIDYSNETTWMGNEAYRVGLGDPFSGADVGGMSLYNSHNNTIIGNTIQADKNAAILFTGSSSNNTVAFNKILGNFNTISFTGLTGTNNTIYQPEQGYFTLPAIKPTTLINNTVYINSTTGGINVYYDGILRYANGTAV